jgi:hypothetical protein
MKKLIIIIAVMILLLGMSATSYAGPVRQYFTNKANAEFAWDYDTALNPDGNGFKLYGVPAATPASTPTVIDIPGAAVKTFTWTNYPTGQFIHWLTAYDKYGNESDPSEQIQVNKKIIKPGVPTTFRLSNPSFTITMP